MISIYSFFHAPFFLFSFTSFSMQNTEKVQKSNLHFFHFTSKFHNYFLKYWIVFSFFFVETVYLICWSHFPTWSGFGFSLWCLLGYLLALLCQTLLELRLECRIFLEQIKDGNLLHFRLRNRRMCCNTAMLDCDA